MSSRLVRVERHQLGPRVHVAGIRVHEWHLGSGILLTLAAGALFDRVNLSLPALLAALVGTWLVAKDWHDLLPSRRDTAAWNLGLHRRHPGMETHDRERLKARGCCYIVDSAGKGRDPTRPD